MKTVFTAIGCYSTVSSNRSGGHIILEATMCLFTDGEHLSCPVIRLTNFTNPGINRNNGHYTVAAIMARFYIAQTINIHTGTVLGFFQRWLLDVFYL